MDHILLLKELKNLIETKLLITITHVILFGSRAHGTANVDSDYDILIVVKESYDWKMKNKIYDISYEIDLKYDLVTDIKIISLEELHSLKGRQPFIVNAFDNGITI